MHAMSKEEEEKKESLFLMNTDYIRIIKKKVNGMFDKKSMVF